MYLERFTLPDADREEGLVQARAHYNGGPLPYIDNTYPCAIFPPKELSEINFDRITILYGGNGSGKSTLLNLIARRLELNRVSPFNSSELFDSYTAACTYETGFDEEEGFPLRIPNGSRIVTSDDVFDYMLAVRTNNEDISENIEEARAGWRELKYGETVKLEGMDDYEKLRLQVLSRSKSVSRRKFVRRTAGMETRLKSNGETALAYFREKLKNDTLYCLDEPENSLSPKLQLELAGLLEELTRYCGCQLILATHSPFLLAIRGARIYDLDDPPVTIKPWQELENTRTYFDFFYKYRRLFRDNED